MSGLRHGLGRIQRRDTDHTGNKSMESECQHNCRSKGLRDTDGFSLTSPLPLHPSLSYDVSHYRPPAPGDCRTVLHPDIGTRWWSKTNAPEQALSAHHAKDGNITNFSGGSLEGATVSPYRLAAERWVVSVQDCPIKMAESNKEEYVCRRRCAAPILFFRQQIIESFDPYNRHNHADPCLIVRKVVHHGFVRNEPSGHGHREIDRLTSRKSLFELMPHRR